MKKVNQLKDGMKVWIPFNVRENRENENYPYRCVNRHLQLSFTEDCTYWEDEPPLEIYEQESIPLLTPVDMEVSDDGVKWGKTKLVCKIGNLYMDIIGVPWGYARPIQKTVTLKIPESELTDELRKYLK